MAPADDSAGPIHNPGADCWWIAAASVLVVAVTTLPYLLAYHVPPDHVFTGILVNPADGNSYLAKMREGWLGSWLFTLPYTAAPGPGVFIFTYYLLLGHLARWTGASLDLVYQLARAVGGLAMLLSAYAFIERVCDSRAWRVCAWLFFAIGSGLGWLAVAFGGFTSDLWVAEAIPFLAVFVNAHFALATALLLWIFIWTVPGISTGAVSATRLVLIALATTALGQVQPLALLSIGLTLAGILAWLLLQKRLTWPILLPALVCGLFAAPWVLYDAAVSYLHPILAQWSAQNFTPSPPLADLALSGGVLLLLALPGAAIAARRRSDRDMALLIWLGLGGLALYAPFALQRRLSLGLWMPLALLATVGLQFAIWPRLSRAWRPLVLALIAVLVLPSNLLVYAATLGAVQRRDPALFLTQAEWSAVAWLAVHADPGAIVAASPDMSLIIPARTSARVVYGHPFETVAAAAHRQAVEDFYSGRMPAAEFVHEYNVSFVVWGGRERALSSTLPATGWRQAFAQGEVVIYAP